METPPDSLAEDEPLILLPEGICPVCEIGRLQPVIGPYDVALPDNLHITVENVPQEVCDHCGEIALGAEASRVIAAAIAEQTEQLKPGELTRIREELGVDQTEMSEILGLGGKTYHRWEKGNQVPSRSMGYYLRVLSEFPEAFAWLRDRGWKRGSRPQTARQAVNPGVAFPNLVVLLRVEARTFGGQEAPIFNPARALFRKAA